MQTTRHATGAADALAAVLTGRRVTAVGGGDRLDLTLDGPVTVRVTGEFRLTRPTEVTRCFPALTVRPTGALLTLVGRTVRAARVTPGGGLELAFSAATEAVATAEAGPGSRTLSVPPHALLGPWSVTTPGGTRFASLPGGEVVRTEDTD
ncbi:DUF6188 family protein [Kitasatospora sp. NPDC056327]|uniref:DUF6188 family protein n=1 Tax=Kitasatospora sp. NPDC056327 TaxID=3345785 RepID=UPI0035DCCD56